MPENPAVPDWSADAVLDRLAARLGPGEKASVHFFLSEETDPDGISDLVTQAASEVALRLGLSDQSVEVGRPLRLSRSVAVRAPLEVVRSLAARSDVVAIMPSDVDDALIRPIGMQRRP